MAVDSTREVRRAVLTLLKTDATVTALVDSASIYGQQTPVAPNGERRVAWPFILVGSLFGAPIRAACVDGLELEGAVHGYAKDRKSGVRTVETAEDHASRIGAAIAGALDRRKVPIAGGTLAIRWTGPRLIADDADGFHTVQGFRFRCLTS